MALSADPYEQRLYQMFQAHDVDACGRLDRDALLKLCHTLELKERSHLLVRCLLSGEDTSKKQQQRVTFKEFREGLLHILGGEEQQQKGAAESGPDSTDGQQNASTGSPTAASSSEVASSSISSLPTSITSHTTKQHLHLPSSHTYKQHRKTATSSSAVDSKKLEPVTESVVVNVVSSSNSNSSSSSIVPSGEDDLGAATTTATITTTPATDNDNEESSDREVSPKFVVGTKKYGRRSRPRQDCNGFDTSSDFSNSDNESVPVAGQGQEQSTDADAAGKSSSKVQRSASQSDIHGSKRRRPMTGSRLKRCASLPTHRQRPAELKLKRDQLNMEHDKIDKKIYFMKLSENLREIWDSLVGTGHGDLLNQSQLEVVCERVGLQKLPARLAAQEVFLKLSLQPIEGISFDEFISLLQSDSDILPITGGGGAASVIAEKDDDDVVAAPTLTTVFDESDNFKAAQELDRDSVEETVGFTMRMPDWTAAEIGSLAATIIVDMWETAGIAEPRQLLQELGFYGEELQVADLVSALDDEQQRLGDGSDTSVIMRASLALHKAEVAALRQAFVQLVEENKKLYSDNKEVNHRATLLAQEVDERHNSLENSTRAKIRLLEQRHHETVKELTSQLAYEREQLSCANAVLEKRIQALELEDGKSKAEIGRLGEENDGLRSEQENLVKELTELLEKNIRLNKDIAELEENNRNDLDDGFDRKDDLEVLELIEKISILQDENTNLRDKNDEFTAEIESLNLELAKFKLKRSGISRTSSVEVSPVVAVESAGAGEESSSAARKRQGDSPSKARLSDESPRLGKFRKCSNDMENESDSSGDWMALQSELGIRVDSGITSSGISQDYSIVSESSGKEEEVRLLKTKVAELEKKLDDRKSSTEESTSEDPDSSKKPDHAKLKARCDELEANMEQLSKEYEACEDYWQSKLNEERQLYEEEQRMADEKFNELLKKMAEYEEQFAGQASSKSEDGRLSPIEEKDVLEQQYLDLEAEFQQAQQMLEEKSHEVEKFRCRILELEQLAKYPSEAMLATPPRIETPEMESPASSPISYLWNQSTIQAPATRDYQNPNWCQPLKVNTSTTESERSCEDSKSPLPPVKPMDQLTVDEEPGFSRTISPIQKPVTAGNSTTDMTSCGGDGQDAGDCSDVCSVKSARSTHSLASTHSIHKSVSQTDVAMVSQEQLKHQRLMQLQLQDEIKELTHQRDCLKMEFQQMTEVKPFLARSYNKTAHPNLTQKIQHLENKNRHLNGMLKQQQTYSEQILHRIWQHQRSEIAEMSNRLEAQSIVIADQAKRLASNDVLVKDLYVENTHLAAQVQRLEQQKVRATLLQQYTQAASGSGHPHPHQLSGIVPGMP